MWVAEEIENKSERSLFNEESEPTEDKNFFLFQIHQKVIRGSEKMLYNGSKSIILSRQITNRNKVGTLKIFTEEIQQGLRAKTLNVIYTKKHTEVNFLAP